MLFLTPMTYIIGVDEAGRGPIVGPVSVGAVSVAKGFDITTEFAGVKDSKKLSEKRREKLFDILETRVAKGDIHFAVALVEASRIDSEGIALAIKESVTKTVLGLAPTPQDVQIFLDGSLKAPEIYVQETIIGGDDSVPIISLASIVAKVVRDRYMRQCAEVYPEYGFEKHKGYGTSAHYEAIAKYGMCPLHRRTFIHT